MSRNGAENYIRAAVEGESAVAAQARASTRNNALNRAAFKLGTIPNMPTDTAMNALLRAAGANGYLKEHGEAATRKVIASGLRSGQSHLRLIPGERGERQLSQKAATNDAAGTTELHGRFPKRTLPDDQGKPVFHSWGDEGPPARDEKRRHVYTNGSEPVRIKVMRNGGGAINWYRVEDEKGRTGWQARKPVGYVEVPYTAGADPFHHEVTQEEIFCPEGEKDADTLVRLGLLAITFGGTGDGAPEGMQNYFVGRDVVVLADNDEGGRHHAEHKAAVISKTAKRVRIVHFPELPEKNDVSDWIELGHGADDLRERAAATAPWEALGSVEPIASPLRRLIAYRASDLEPEKLVWVWPGRIPEGKLVLLGGPPGLGKSQLTAFMSATVSNGGHWPCGEGSTLPGDVIFMSAEDGVQDTIIPRLMAAGANRERIHIVSAATKPDGTGRKTFSLKTDVDLLEEMAKKIGTVRLIIVDPISAYMGGSDGNGNVETREVLEPLADMANRLRIAVVAVTHLNKGGGGGNQSALNRFAGSIAFVAAARAAFAVIEDPEADERRFLLQAKNNLGKKCKGLAFRLEQRLVGDDVMSSNVMFEGEHVSESIDEALTASENRGSKKGQTGGKEDVMQFLKDILSAGPVDVLEVERQARAAALLEDDKRLSKSKAFRDARDALGVKTTREGFGPGSKFVLSLTEVPHAGNGTANPPLAPIGAIGAPSETRAPMEENGAYGEAGGPQ